MISYDYYNDDEAIFSKSYCDLPASKYNVKQRDRVRFVFLVFFPDVFSLLFYVVLYLQLFKMLRWENPGLMKE